MKLVKKLRDFEPNGIDLLVGFLLTIFLALTFLVYEDLVYNPDLRFLYNRALQMYNCCEDDIVPWFFYNDFNGVGYGSSFFYGYLTLYPFLLFVKLGIKPFLCAYMTTTVVLTYIGSCFLAKRFTTNYRLVGLIFITSSFSIQYLSSLGTYANHLGVALGFFFIAKCIDFFRDNKSFIPASILFWLIINTHLISALLNFIVCVLIMIMYYKKDRFIDYVKFALCTCLVCSYFVVNFLYHSNVINNTSSINKQMIKHISEGFNIGNVQSTTPFLGVLDTIILNIFGIEIPYTGYKVILLSVLILLLIFLVKRFRSLSHREIFCLCVIFIGFILSFKDIWILLNSFFLVPFQFPVRYTPYILLCFIIIACKNVNMKSWMICLVTLLVLPDVVLNGFCIMPLSDEYRQEQASLLCQVMNGEYLDKSFTWNLDEFNDNSTHVYDSDGNSYSYDIDKNKLIIHITDAVDETVLQAPKLYYKGYICYDADSGEKFDITMGYSQFINIRLPKGYVGDIVLFYNHPFILQLMCILCIVLVISLIIIDITKYCISISASDNEDKSCVS